MNPPLYLSNVLFGYSAFHWNNSWLLNKNVQKTSYLHKFNNLDYFANSFSPFSQLWQHKDFKQYILCARLSKLQTIFDIKIPKKSLVTVIFRFENLPFNKHSAKKSQCWVISKSNTSILPLSIWILPSHQST